jgi:hypothetical protein
MKRTQQPLTILTLSASSIAQIATGKLTGAVTDETQRGLESVTVSFLKTKHSALDKNNSSFLMSNSFGAGPLFKEALSNIPSKTTHQH